MAYEGPGIYRHFKGGMYYALGTAAHSETGEEVVVYRPMHVRSGVPELCVRPRAMFDEKVDRPLFTQPGCTVSETVQRFERTPPAYKADPKMAHPMTPGRPCASLSCGLLAVGDGAYCYSHGRLAAEKPVRCTWDMCARDATQGGLCDFHQPQRPGD